jgi:hypothetical protein
MNQIVIEIATWLLMSLPMVAEVLTDYKDYKAGTKDNKPVDVILRGLLIAFTAFVVKQYQPDVPFWHIFLLGVGIYIMFFDFIMGYLIKGNIFYLGETSKLDKLLKSTPLEGIVFVRGTIFVSTIAVYYDWGTILV